MPHRSHLPHPNRQHPGLISHIAAGILMAASVLAPMTAHAFAEDLCFQYADPQAKSGDVIPNAFNCWNVQCTDSVAPEKEPAGCVVKGVMRYINATIAKGLHGRNTVHFDTLFLFSRMLGLLTPNEN